MTFHMPHILEDSTHKMVFWSTPPKKTLGSREIFPHDLSFPPFFRCYEVRPVQYGLGAVALEDISVGQLVAEEAVNLE